MHRSAGKQAILAAIASLGLIGVSACNETNRSATADNVTAPAANQSVSAARTAPNPSVQAPPSTAFASFERLDAGRFRSTQQFTVFNPTYFARNFPGALDTIQYNYVYADGRFDSVHSYDTDVTLQIIKFDTPERAQAFLRNAIARSIPIAQAASVRLPPCQGQKSASDDFVGPEKLVRTLPNPRGGEITILQSGDFNMHDCARGSNRAETAIWTEGQYYFLASALPMSARPDDTGYGRAQELAVDYTAALGPRS